MMWLVADVHGAVEALARVARQHQPLIVLGDLINLVDYRSGDGIISDVSGRALVEEFITLRAAGDDAAARELWRNHAAGREEELRARYDEFVEEAYAAICAALDGATAYVTYGNADRPSVLRRHLPETARFVDAEVVDIEGVRVGFAGGGVPRIGAAGEVDEDTMAAKLDALGPVDVLCTHVPPSVRPLSGDVIAGDQKGSPSVLAYVLEHRPSFHYFGDIHQPQATTWRVGSTICRNAGYFRATERAVAHG